MYGRRRPVWVIPVVIGVLILVIIIVDRNIGPTLSEIARTKAQLMGVECINKAVNEQVVRDIEYRDLVLVRTDDRGRVVLIQPNTIKISQLMAKSSLEIAEALDQLSETSLGIPLGQMFGSTFLAGYGPKVRVKVIPAGTVNVDIISKFQSAGINQSRHLIYLKVSSKLKVVVPFSSDEVKVATTIPVAETIIVGDVPGMYVSLEKPNAITRSAVQSLSP